MRLQYGIAANLCVIACLTSFMLAIGGEEYWLPIFVFVMGMAAFYLTDLTRLVRLNDWFSNAIILLIVFLSVGNIVQHRGEDLGNGIARIVVFVQVVLLFKEKRPRNCWHILILSFLQVIVASVFRQSLGFAILLLFYIFASTSAICLVFLYRENLYFQRHSFVRNRQEVLATEFWLKEQDKGRLLKIVIATLLTGPIALFLSFRERRREEEETSPADSPARPGATWDIDNFWDEEPTDEESDSHENRRFSSQWRSGFLSFRRRRETAERWPLLDSVPKFSGGTRRNGGSGSQWELFAELIRGTLLVLLLASIVFLLFPRFTKIDLFGVSIVRESWKRSGMGQVASVGFTRDVRLGSIGNVIQNHREIMSVRYFSGLHEPDLVFGRTIRNGKPLPPPPLYESIHGKTVYMRGVALSHYDKGAWSDPRHSRSRIGGLLAPAQPVPQVKPNERIPSDRQPGRYLPLTPGNDPVTMIFDVQPLDSTILFTPWPFFPSRDSREDGAHIHDDLFVCEDVQTHAITLTVYTTAFTDGIQEPVTPHQESLSLESLTQLPEDAAERLQSLVTLAKQWDAESGLPRNDILGRARYFEAKLSEPGHFRYQLGGIEREYDLDPIEDFIRNHPVGHCEYFASALALMLRSVGIGSRVVVGFKTDCSDSLGGAFTVRQSEAHAWVEAHLPRPALPEELRSLSKEDPRFSWWLRGGWLRLDPTPQPGPTPLTIRQGWTQLIEWIGHLWRDYVLNLDPARQSTKIYAPLRSGTVWVGESVFHVGFWKRAIPEILNRYAELIRDLRAGQWHPGRLATLLLPPLALLILIPLSLRLLWIRAWRLIREREETARKRSGVAFYYRVEEALAKIGLKREPAETQAAFLRHCESRLPVSLEPIADAFYRVRFGGITLSEDDLRAIDATLTRLLETIHPPKRPTGDHDDKS